MTLRVKAGLIPILALLGVAGSASGQLFVAGPESMRSKTYGVDDDASLTVNAYEYWFSPNGTETAGPEDPNVRCAESIDSRGASRLGKLRVLVPSMRYWWP